ncbi:E3 ubiquitin-protein ligase MBR2-like [Primulina huaijiensis]|uniref:E3 ubiquitin-protein ligase MBR2-like n=1 Tax=Primulina huaijiensis TaxID=1492673 RepID=UPI003CC76634
MQEERSTLNSFPETIDLNQGPFPSNTSIDYPPSWDNMVNPVENRLPNYMFASSDENIRCTNDTNNCGQRFSGWECGESSSSANNLQDQACNDDPKTRLRWSPSFPDYFAANARPEDNSFAQANICSASYVGNQVDGGSLNVQNYNSNRGSLNVSSNHQYVRESSRHFNLGSGPPHTQHPYSLTETQHIQNFNASSSHVGSSVGDSSIHLENNEMSGPSLSTWGTSCKRKAIEGTSGQSYHGGSSSSDQQMEDMMKHSVSGCYTAPGDLTITSGPLNLSQLNHPEQLNTSDGIGINRASPAFFPSSRIPTSEQCPATNFSVTLNLDRLESDPLETSRGTSARHSSVYSSEQLSRPISNTNSLELRSPFALLLNPTNTPNQSHSMHLNEAMGLPSHPWRESTLLDSGSSSSSLVSGERGSGANARSSYRTNSEIPMIAPTPETRSDVHDQIDWSFAPGASPSPRHHSSGSRTGLSSGGSASSGARLPHPNMASQNSQRLSEVAPWIPFLNIDSDSETQRSHSALFPLASLSSHDAASTSRAQHQPDQRSASFLTDMPGDDTSRRRALATVERRHRLIRQVLNAMRRGVHLQAEDYMVIDPFVNGFVELHDRYRDMRLDVDNMSYEELLALEDRIGNVSTGLDEEKISSSMKQKIYEAMSVSPNLEPCCICQEDYVAGDGMGMLDCGHEFHTICIKQWLLLKNLCPVCKTTGLGT